MQFALNDTVINCLFIGLTVEIFPYQRLFEIEFFQQRISYTIGDGNIGVPQQRDQVINRAAAAGVLKIDNLKAVPSAAGSEKNIAALKVTMNEYRDLKIQESTDFPREGMKGFFLKPAQVVDVIGFYQLFLYMKIKFKQVFFLIEKTNESRTMCLKRGAVLQINQEFNQFPVSSF